MEIYLIDVDGVSAIMGTWASSVTTAVAPLCWESGVMLFTVLRQQNEMIARTALYFYVLEAALLAASKLETFSLLQVSREYAAGGGQNAEEGRDDDDRYELGNVDAAADDDAGDDVALPVEVGEASARRRSITCCSRSAVRAATRRSRSRLRRRIKRVRERWAPPSSPRIR